MGLCTIRALCRDARNIIPILRYKPRSRQFSDCRASLGFQWRVTAHSDDPESPHAEKDLPFSSTNILLHRAPENKIRPDAIRQVCPTYNVLLCWRLGISL